MRNYYRDSPNGDGARSQLHEITKAIQTLVFQAEKVLFRQNSGLVTMANFYVTTLPMQEILQARLRFDQHYQIYDSLIGELAIPVDYVHTFQQCFAVLRQYVNALKDVMAAASQAQAVPVGIPTFGGHWIPMHLTDRNNLIEYLAVLQSETGIDPLMNDEWL